MKCLTATTTVAQLNAHLHQQADEVATLRLALDMQRNRIALRRPDMVWPARPPRLRLSGHSAHTAVRAEDESITGTTTRIRRGNATTGTALSAGNLPASPPTPLGARARLYRGSSRWYPAPRRRAS